MRGQAFPLAFALGLAGGLPGQAIAGPIAGIIGAGVGSLIGCVITYAIASREEINGNNVCLTYLYRWTLLKAGSLFSIYLHKFVGDDWSLDLHDHPKRFWSIGLWGNYTEWTLDRNYVGGMRPRLYCAPWVRTFPATHIHRLTGPTPQTPCWTLVIVGRVVQPWGFWTADPNGGRTFVPWRKYVNSGDAATNRNCL